MISIKAIVNKLGGENYQYLEQQNIAAYISLLVGALNGNDGFIYDEQNEWYICRNV